MVVLQAEAGSLWCQQMALERGVMTSYYGRPRRDDKENWGAFAEQAASCLIVNVMRGSPGWNVSQVRLIIEPCMKD